MTSVGRSVRDLPPGVRRERLLVLTTPSSVRADVIRQFHERGKDEMVEVLTEMEADKLVRLRVVEQLQQLEAAES